MLMKVFNKGQIVIPAEYRHELGINIGDKLNFTIDKTTHEIKIRKPEYKAKILAGSLKKYAIKKRYPSKDAIRKAMAEKWAEKHEK